MKGLVTIEFIISVSVFVATVAFLAFNIISSISPLHESSVNEIKRSEAYQISQLLIFDRGEPDNWNENLNNIVRIGLSSEEPYKISSDKLQKLNDTCRDDYEKLKNLLSISNRSYIIIDVNDMNGNNIVSCKKDMKPVFSIERFAVLEDNRIVKIIIGIL